MGIKIKLIKSVSGSDLWQRATVTGLGLKKFGDERLLKDTPAIRGMRTRPDKLQTARKMQHRGGARQEERLLRAPRRPLPAEDHARARQPLGHGAGQHA